MAGASLPAQPAHNSAPSHSDLLPLAPLAAGRFSESQLEELLAPIALYPDALIALMLPAATAPADIVLAARHVRAAGDDRSQVEHRSWDESVKSLTHYPTVLLWMDENLPWTKQVGEAFGEQPVEVMQAIQRLRARARAAGTLVDTPEQQVLAEVEAIRIVPAQPDTLYVPYYDWTYAYANPSHAYTRPLLSFGIGFPVGSWLAFECDWRRHTIWVGNRHRRWHGHDWRQPVVPIPAVAHPYGPHRDVRPWRPAERPGRPPVPSRPPRGGPGFVHSAPAPNPPASVSSPHFNRPPPGSPGYRAHRPVAPVAPPSAVVTAGTAPPLNYNSPAPSTPPPPTHPTPPHARPDTRRGPDRPRPSVAAPEVSPRPRPTSPPPERTYTSAPGNSPGAPAARPREGDSHRPPPVRPAPATSVRPAPQPAPSRNTPPPSTTAPASVPASPPPPAATPNRTEGDSQRSIGRRPPNEHQR